MRRGSSGDRQNIAAMPQNCRIQGVIDPWNQSVHRGRTPADQAGMNVIALSNISDPYIQSLIASSITRNSTYRPASSSIDPSSLSLAHDSSPRLSPLAKMLSTLQQLQQSDPAKYQQVTAQIATNLQDAAKTATANGNTTQANELNQLATDFTNASRDNTLPNIQDLAQAIGGGHRHHHAHAAQSSSDTAGSSAADGTSSTSQSSTTSVEGLSKLISAFLVNSISASQNSSLDPIAIIHNTLSNAGISL